jgi:hypothetical protein
VRIAARREAARRRLLWPRHTAITAAAAAVARNRMGMVGMDMADMGIADMAGMDTAGMGHGQMRLHKSRKALAVAAVVVVRLAPCKTIARTRTVKGTVNRTVPRQAASSRERAWPFCTAK